MPFGEILVIQPGNSSKYGNAAMMFDIGPDILFMAGTGHTVKA